MSRVESQCIDLKVITCLGGICILDYEGIFDCMVKILLTLTYPFLVGCFIYCSSIFAMIINLLMGADARGTRGQQGRDDFAA